MVFEAVEVLEEIVAENGVHSLNDAMGDEKPSAEVETTTDADPILLPSTKDPTPPPKKKPRILVIGAGMAGLCAARELQQRGYQTLVVEARHRPGGRLHSIALPGAAEDTHHVDVGGALIHGIVDNPVYTMVDAELEQATRPLSDCLLLSGETGWPVDVALDERVLGQFNDCLAEAFARVEAPRQEESFGALFQRICQERHVNVQQALFQWHQANLEISCGASFPNLGLDWNEDEPFGFDGDHVALRHSWKPVCDTLAASLYILYNAPVQRIHIVHPPPSSSAVDIAPMEEDHSIVNPEDPPPEPVEGARHMRLSTPNATRPRHAVAPRRSPPTPTRRSRRLRGEDTSDLRRSERANKGLLAPPTLRPKTTAPTAKRPRPADPSATVVQVTMQSGITWQVDAVVCTIPLGVLKDGSVTFDPPLPQDKQKAIQSLGTGLLNKCVLTFAKRFWQNSDFLGLADASHSYLVLNAAKYTEKPVLLFMYGGSFAKEMEDWTDAAVVEDCLSVLRRMCGRDSVTPPLDYHVTRWGHDPYARMSFTYVPPGVQAHDALAALRQPIYDHTGRWPVLMFAGEHTTPYHPSTIHGAYFSGIREAYRWDCAWDPDANHGLDYSEDHVYQRTFVVEARGKAKSPGPRTTPALRTNPVALAPPPLAYRRRRVHGEMTLRRRPKSYIQMTSSRKSAGDTPMRQSPRRTMAAATATPSQAPNAASTDGLVVAKETPKLLSREQRLPLEQRILWRSIESFGPNFGYIEQMVFPVHESVATSTSFRGIRQIEKRGRKFLEQRDKRLAQRQKMIRFWYKSWLATEVAPPSNSSTTITNGSSTMDVARLKKRNGSTMPTNAAAKTRRKGHAAPTSVTTRFGRTTKPPPV